MQTIDLTARRAAKAKPKFALAAGNLASGAESPIGEFASLAEARAKADRLAQCKGEQIAPWIEADQGVWQLGGEGGDGYWIIRQN